MHTADDCMGVWAREREREWRQSNLRKGTAVSECTNRIYRNIHDASQRFSQRPKKKMLFRRDANAFIFYSQVERIEIQIQAEFSQIQQ